MNKKVKQIALGVILILSLGLLAGCGNQETIGYVDKAKILTESTKAKEVREKMLAKSNEVKERLEKAQASQTPEEFAKTKQSVDQEMMIYEGAVLREFQSYIESNLAAVAKEKNLGIIIDKAAMTTGGVDVTADLLKRLESNKTESATTEKK